MPLLFLTILICAALYIVIILGIFWFNAGAGRDRAELEAAVEQARRNGKFSASPTTS